MENINKRNISNEEEMLKIANLREKIKYYESIKIGEYVSTSFAKKFILGTSEENN